VADRSPPDRLIQQAVLQVLQKRWDSTFSEHSYGFRPGRSAHQAVAQAQRYVADGYNVVVDLDLEKFFDGVNHDILMARVAERIADKRVLKLIRCERRERAAPRAAGSRQVQSADPGNHPQDTG
jgi:retron-type reverse transcriptase